MIQEFRFLFQLSRMRMGVAVNFIEALDRDLLARLEAAKHEEITE